MSWEPCGHRAVKREGHWTCEECFLSVSIAALDDLSLQATSLGLERIHGSQYGLLGRFQATRMALAAMDSSKGCYHKAEWDGNRRSYGCAQCDIYVTTRELDTLDDWSKKIYGGRVHGALEGLMGRVAMARSRQEQRQNK
jgi:hypothetical protein